MFRSVAVPPSRERRSTQLWSEVGDAPATVRRTLDANGGTLDRAVALLSGADRVIVTGNGAAWYAAAAMSLAMCRSGRGPAEVAAVPAGLLASGTVAVGPGDGLVVVSSSGELRDIVELVDAGVTVPMVAITADAASTIGRAAAVAVLTTVGSQRAVTHTQSYLGNVVSALRLAAGLNADRELDDAVAGADTLLADAFAAADAAAAAGAVGEHAAGIVLGTGPAWAAAQEGALLLAEVAGIPTQGMETREAATTGMYALRPGDLVVSLRTGAGDPLALEAEEICRDQGALVVAHDGTGPVDPRLAAITTFPAAAALAIDLGLARGRDVDQPPWVASYYRTARVAAPAASPARSSS